MAAPVHSLFCDDHFVWYFQNMQHDKAGLFVCTSMMAILFCFLSVVTAAQSPSYNFHQLGSANGLSDPAIRSIAQDKYGYIWIGTLNGLNRFNGYEVKVFQHIFNDNFSLPENFVPALAADDIGNLWIAQSKGLYKYDYNSNHFILFPGSNRLTVYQMIPAGKAGIYMATNEGLVLFNTAKGIFIQLKENVNSLSTKLLNIHINHFCLTDNSFICLATDSGIVKYDISKREATMINLPNLKDKAFEKIAVDGAKNIWITNGAQKPILIKISPDFLHQTVYPGFFVTSNNLRDNQITSIFSDSKGRLWISAVRNGLCLYDTSTDKFIQYQHDPLQATSISDNLVTTIYQDREGLIWIGTEVTGINYFDPDKTMFHIIQPSYNQSPTLPDYWCRAAGEDAAGNLWLGTGSGIAKYDAQKNSYTLFQNTANKSNAVQYNSIRSVLCDGDFVWIGTANGLNRYHRSTGKMDFTGERNNLPLSFFWSIAKGHNNDVWFGTRDGIYRYNSRTQTFESPVDEPGWGAYARNNTISIYEDSRHRMWFGFYSKGLLMVDAANNKIKTWVKNDARPGSLSNNHVTSVTEDKTGVIWVATLEGLNAWNEKTDSFTQYLRGPGKVAENIAALLVDDKNRLWMAGSKSLYMLDAERNFFTPFDISNGLPTVDFNYQAAFRMKNGDFIYPTLRGFVQFNPNKFGTKNNSPDAYISSFRVYGKEPATFINFEDRQNISLAAAENFFSMDMVALNYGNPKEIWYAHQLEPFDKEWVYSKDRMVNYTNVPGGDYSFHFKTSADTNNWNTPEKILRIHLDTPFNKTGWFRLLIGFVVALILFSIYKYRIAQKEKLYALQSKANALEKEKVLVMYESLKQQLNPHFLFNSLTSLSGLIASNPTHARQFLERMSKIYRYILKSRDHETVALAEEIKLAETYSQLQQTRFGKGLQLHIDVAEEYLHRKIAPVTIQNLIENAIKHNIVDVLKPLITEIYIEDDHIVVRNMLQKKKFVPTSNGQGLANLKSLYHYLSGRPVIVTEDEHYFTIKIPLI